MQLVMAILISMSAFIASATAQELNSKHKGGDWVTAPNVEKFTWAGKGAVIAQFEGRRGGRGARERLTG